MNYRPLFVSLVLMAGLAGTASAHMGFSAAGVPASSDGHTAQEEVRGNAIWEKLQAKQTACADLKNEDFAALGEHFMGAMMGESHEAMNAMMTSMLGAAGEEQMHEVLGKRLSGCDPEAALPAGSAEFMPMMQFVGGGWGGMMGGGFSGMPYYRSMMGYGYGEVNWPGFLGVTLWWIFAIVGIVFVIRKVVAYGGKK